MHAPAFLGALLLLTLLLGGCASYGRPLPEVAPEINATFETGPVLIEPGDMIDLRFARKSDWNVTTRVRADGRTSFPAIGEHRVAGMTVHELEHELVDDYRPILAQPELAVNLGESTAGDAERDGVIVTGEVTRPGMVSLHGERLTLVEALGRAGGQLKATSLLGNTLLLRRCPRTGLYQSWRIDAREVHWGIAEPVYLQRHDLVFVPNTPIDNVDIWIDQYINKTIPMGLTSFAVGIAVGRT
jgi:protein involved in polysaccharide export with SLBB domain